MLEFNPWSLIFDKGMVSTYSRGCLKFKSGSTCLERTPAESRRVRMLATGIGWADFSIILNLVVFPEEKAFTAV